MIGKTVSHYKIIEKIGEGGMGVVYKAEDTKLKRTVALKFLPPELTREAEAKARFEREAQAAAALNHPNIVTIYEIGEHEGQTYIAMEYVDGETLRDKIKSSPEQSRRDKRIKTEESIEIAIQIAEGLAKAHQAGIVHRDIKPENILIDNDGRVKILDFGLAKLKGSGNLTKETSTLGTVNYMSPEQVKGEAVDHRTDIWSLGVVLYEMLTGELPFKGDYEQAVMYAIINEEVKLSASAHKDISEELVKIVLKCLQKNKENRYRSIHEFLESLNKYQKGNKTDKSIKNVLLSKRTITLVSVIVAIILFIFIYIFIQSKENKVFDSIAVLPFKNLSTNQENEYFCDGVTEDIIAQLSKIANLKVISRTSIMQYKTIKKSLPEIADELDVTMILEGTVRQSDNRVRIVAQLIEAREDKHIWAETYDRELKDIFAIQSDVAEKIAGVLKVELSAKEISQIQKKPTENLAAYNLYLKGREYYSRYQKEDNNQAIRLFKKAVEIDSNYAQAYAGLGDAYSMGYHRFGFSSTWIDSAIRISKKAIEIDPNSAEAYKALGTSYSVNDRSSLAIAEYKKAIELNPGYYTAVGNLGYRYLKSGLLEDALKWNKKEMEQNPAFDGAYIKIGLVYNILCEDLKAQHAFEKALELDPQDVYSYWGLISLYLAQNKYEKALAESDKILKFTTDKLNAYTYAGYVEHIRNNLSEAYNYFKEAIKISQAKFFYNYQIISQIQLAAIQWKKGEKEKAKIIFSDFLTYANIEIDLGNESWAIPYNIAGIYSLMDEHDKAFLWLDRAIDAGWREYRIGKIEPLFENLRQDNRFEQRIEHVKKIVDIAREQIKAAEK